MSKPFPKHIAFLIFVIFMTHVGAWGFSSAKLAHEFEHNDNGIKQAATAHQYVDTAVVNIDDDDDDDDDLGLDLVEHQVLHAVDHLQFFPDTALGCVFSPARANIVLLHFTEQALPLLTLEPLLRPPRKLTV
jgi:hypothetical protein